MKARCLFVIVVFLLASGCSILGMNPLAGLVPTTTPAPTAPAVPPLEPTTCGFQASHEERSEIAGQIQDTLSQRGVPVLAVSVTDYGEAFICSDGSSSLVPENRITRITLEVNDLEDQQTMGNYAHQVLEVPAVLGASGEVQLIFLSDFDQVVVPLMASTGRAALAQNAEGRPFWLALLQGKMGEYIYGLAFSPNGRYLATTSQDGFVRLWRVSDGTLLQAVYQQQDGNASNPAFTADGAELVYASGCDLVFRGTSSAVVTRRYTGQTCNVQALAVSPDGQYLAVSSDSGTFLQIWSLTDNQLVTSLSDTGITSLAFSPDSTMLAAGSLSTTDLFWQVEPLTGSDPSPAYSLTLQPPLAGQYCPVDSLTYSLDGGKIALAFCSRSVQVWDAASYAQLMTIDRVAYAASFSPQDSTLALGTIDGAQLVSLASGETLVELDSPSGASSEIQAWVVLFSPDGATLAAGYGGIVRLWRASSGELLHTLGTLGQD